MSSFKYAYVSGYANNENGKIMQKAHPSVIMKLDDGKELIFPFTSESLFGVQNETTGKVDEKYCVELSSILKEIRDENNGEGPTFKMMNTAIRDEKELSLTRNFYRHKLEATTDVSEKRNINRLLEKVRQGYVCEHPVKEHKGYLSSEVPLLDAGTNIKVISQDMYKRGAVSSAKIEYNIKFFGHALNVCENAMLEDKLKYYESSNKPFEYFAAIVENKFDFKSRLDIAYEINSKKHELKHEVIPSKIEYLNRIEPLFKNKSEIEQHKFAEYKLETKMDDLYDKIDKQNKVIDQDKLHMLEAKVDGSKEMCDLAKEIYDSSLKKKDELMLELKETKEEFKKVCSNAVEKEDNTENSPENKKEPVENDDFEDKIE